MWLAMAWELSLPPPPPAPLGPGKRGLNMDRGVLKPPFLAMVPTHRVPNPTAFNILKKQAYTCTAHAYDNV